MAQNEVISLADERERLNKHVSDLREELSSKSKDASRVPALEQEVERLKSREEKLRADADRRQEENAASQQEVREYESKLRDAYEQIQAFEKELKGRDSADEALSEAEESAKFQESIVNSQQVKIADLEREVERLRNIEKAAREDVSTRDALRDHLGV